MLKINNLSKTFQNKKIIDTISFEVKKGEIAIFLGSSGVGKSTLLRLLSNLETIDSGTIFLENTPLDHENIGKQHTVGIVFQQFNLFPHLTVEQNITLALEKVLKKNKSDAKNKAQILLKQYNLTEKSEKYPDQLSGGQKQRLAIARAVALQPKIICFDEPTSALDPLLTSHVAQTIQQLANDGYIVLVATHDVVLLKKLNCTIYLMSQGKIIESTTASAFKTNPEQFPLIATFVSGEIKNNS